MGPAGSSCHPVAWLSPGVSDGHHDDAILLDLVEDHEGEALKDDASPRCVPGWELLGVLTDLEHRAVDGRDELQPESRSARLVLYCGLRDLVFGVCMDDDR